MADLVEMINCRCCSNKLSDVFVIVESKVKKENTECRCPKCVECCERAPGWMTPEEAQRAIDAGRARDLMVDWWQTTRTTSSCCARPPSVTVDQRRPQPQKCFHTRVCSMLDRRRRSPAPCCETDYARYTIAGSSRRNAVARSVATGATLRERRSRRSGTRTRDAP